MRSEHAPFDETEIAAIIRRAMEISHEQNLVERLRGDSEDIVKAAEEAGIPREATLQALRERLEAQTGLAKAGDEVFGLSADNRFYPAVVVSSEASFARIRFINGSEVDVPLRDLRPFRPVPGAEIEYFSRQMSMWLRSKVIAYHRDARTVTVSTFGTEETVTLDRIRMKPDVQPGTRAAMMQEWSVRLTWLLAGAGAGGLIVAFLLRLLN